MCKICKSKQVEIFRYFKNLSKNNCKKNFFTLKFIKLSFIIYYLDVDDEASIMAAKMEVENYLGQCGLNLLLNNAGIKAGLRLDTINTEDMLQVYKTNVVGPCLMVKVIFCQIFLFLLLDNISYNVSAICLWKDPNDCCETKLIKFLTLGNCFKTGWIFSILMELSEINTT